MKRTFTGAALAIVFAMTGCSSDDSTDLLPPAKVAPDSSQNNNRPPMPLNNTPTGPGVAEPSSKAGEEWRRSFPVSRSVLRRRLHKSRRIGSRLTAYFRISFLRASCGALRCRSSWNGLMNPVQRNWHGPQRGRLATQCGVEHVRHRALAFIASGWQQVEDKRS